MYLSYDAISRLINIQWQTHVIELLFATIYALLQTSNSFDSLSLTCAMY